MRWITYSSGIAILNLLFMNWAMASVDSIGPNGINSINLALTGNGVDIGQVETGRPGSENVDTDLSSSNLYHTAVDPADVFRRHPENLHFVANANNGAEVTSHAVEIAGIMISTDAVARGVAPEAD